MWEQELYDNLNLYCKFIAKDCISVVRTDTYELEVVCKDGSVYIYNDMEHSVGRKIDTTTDEGWRKEFARRLRKKIAMKGMGQVRLSELTGISQPLLSDYMNCKKIPSAQKVSSLAKALNCSVNDLIGF